MTVAVAVAVAVVGTSVRRAVSPVRGKYGTTGTGRLQSAALDDTGGANYSVQCCSATVLRKAPPQRYSPRSWQPSLLLLMVASAPGGGFQRPV